MKYIYFFMFLLTTQLISAQDSRLFRNTWYLTKIIENGVDYFPPTNAEVSNITLTFNQQISSLDTRVCNVMSGQLIFENNLTHFASSNNFVQTLMICDLMANINFEPYYFSFLTLETNFSYTISENGTEKKLTIVNLTNNKQAIYSSESLSTTDFKELDFSVHSDSSTDFVIIELKNPNVENTKVEIFDGLGKMHKNKYFNSDQTKIDIKDLSVGIYIVKITNDDGVGVKKFIKL